MYLAHRHALKGAHASMNKTKKKNKIKKTKRIKNSKHDNCWWCTGSPRQTRVHLFKKCPRWMRAQDNLWECMMAENDEDGNPDDLNRNASIPTLLGHLKEKV